jgi:hypothetical protein
MKIRHYASMSLTSLGQIECVGAVIDEQQTLSAGRDGSGEEVSRSLRYQGHLGQLTTRRTDFYGVAIVGVHGQHVPQVLQRY